MADSKITSMSSEFNPMTSKNTWTLHFDDGTIQKNEYPTFIQQCSLCWKLVDKRESKCLCQAICCKDCKLGCEKEGECRLK